MPHFRPLSPRAWLGLGQQGARGLRVPLEAVSSCHTIMEPQAKRLLEQASLVRGTHCSGHPRFPVHRASEVSCHPAQLLSTSRGVRNNQLSMLASRLPLGLERRINALRPVMSTACPVCPAGGLLAGPALPRRHLQPAAVAGGGGRLALRAARLPTACCACARPCAWTCWPRCRA